MKHQSYRPILITDARPSEDDQLRSRKARYLTMMSVRAGCLVVGAILVVTEAPLLGLWLPVCGAGMVLLPWLAVLVANDRPVREEKRLGNVLRRRWARNVPARTAHHVLPAEPLGRSAGGAASRSAGGAASCSAGGAASR